MGGFADRAGQAGVLSNRLLHSRIRDSHMWSIAAVAVVSAVVIGVAFVKSFP
ncbi:hypothetical protein NRB20_07860 [Nocardia sp. RB20]|uniref:Uncharacterized protein n=1 Tax=Nocardia macrotermitis TaxID=2585198 RepID=A0A7K0CXQ5_9NOCA|nr:hypothetical protein [Nocardia macrotermitis]